MKSNRLNRTHSVISKTAMLKSVSSKSSVFQATVGNHLHRFSMLLTVLCVFYLSGCTTEETPTSSTNQTQETSFGVVMQVDDYPLFTLNYTADYHFDSYLQTGSMPVATSFSTAAKNFACTCFSAFGGENRWLGRNYDWPEPSTYFLVFTDPPDGYASVSTVDLTFFAYDHTESPDYPVNQTTLRTLPFFPFDGINEAGVAIGMNAVPEARAPMQPDKVTIGELQLIRLVLDYAASTEEAVALIKQYNIRMEEPPIHYLIADSSGRSVIVEFNGGEMEIIENTAPWQVTTNFVISGLQNWQEAPCWRYTTTYQSLQESEGVLQENTAFYLLQKASVPTTRWSTVFDLKSGHLKLAVGRNFEKKISSAGF
ncbi:MAG: linear amide C-N hydrolase [Calditrichaeota bacterium]|nr:MAG: linear amide C-N hydrolase [Calditrichota bacterium]